MKVNIGEQQIQNGKIGDISRFIYEKKNEDLRHLFTNNKYSSSLNWFIQKPGQSSIKLEFSFFTPGRLLQTVKTKTTKYDLDGKKLNNDLKILLESKAMSDFTIRCKSIELECHSNILFARSAFFANLFSSGMVETKKKDMEIVDLEPESVAMMLEYLYTGDVDTTDKNLGDLITLADKYQLTELFMLATERLSQQVTEGNVLDVFKLSEKLGAEDMKRVAINKVMENKATWMKKEAFRKKLLICPTLMMELLKIND